MIKPGFILALAGLCVLLVLCFFLTKDSRPVAQSAPSAKGKLAPDFNPESVKSIDIKKDTVAIKLEKKDKDWVIGSDKNRPAKSDRVDSLLKSVKEASLGDPRSGSNLSNFDVDDKGRTDLVLHRESGETKLVIGKNVGGNSCFIRKDDAVYETDKALDTDAGVRTEQDKRVLDPSYFYDLKIFSITADDIIDIAIKKGHNVVRIQRVIPGKGPILSKEQPGKDDPKPIWWITEPEGIEANDSTVSSICSNIAFLNAKSYADSIPEKDRGLDKPSVKVKLRLKDGTEHTLSFGKIEGDDVVMAVSGRSDPFKVYKYVFDTVNKDYADLKKKDDDKDKKDTAANPSPSPLPTPHFPAPIPAATNQSHTDAPPIPPPAKAPQIIPSPPPAVVKPADEKK